MPETLDEIKKYVGPFSGPQMDQIFYEILNYTSERFAKGTAGGVPVAAGTPGYNDNSLFYKNQAAAQVLLARAAAAAAANSAQRAESAVPAGTDAAVLWTRDQSTELTADDKAVARKNIMAGGSNRNLLDNPWFTVNQRGNTSGNFTATTKIDRWRTSYATSYNGTWTLNDGILTITADSSYAYFVQRFEDYSFMSGKTLTASLMLSDGTIVSGTAVRTTGRNDLISVAGKYGVYIATSGEFTIQVNPNQTLAIKAAKLEYGSVSTLANDAPPCYAEELAKCQRYFIRFANDPLGFGFISGALTRGFALLPLPVTLRTPSPTISINGSVEVKSAGETISVSNIVNYASWANAANGLGVQVNFSSSATGIGPFVLSLLANGYIDISADL